MANQAQLGARVKAYRENLGMTVEELGLKSQVDVRTITRLENGTLLPGMGAMFRIAKAMGQRLGTFMDDQYEPDPIISRAEEPVDAEGVKMMAHGKPDRNMDPYWIELDEKGTVRNMTFEGEFFMLVIDGEVELNYGDRRETLKKGDSAYFNALVSHNYKAIGGRKATVVGVHYMPM
ncbi:MAG: helix-turn-helix domain-containing protein [Kiritimatiellae bacterium]|nr:helix-turn-helix domain-containing protein [Kiritimatiellia bacterium]